MRLEWEIGNDVGGAHARQEGKQWTDFELEPPGLEGKETATMSRILSLAM